jgi:prevent-host-death family protein
MRSIVIRFIAIGGCVRRWMDQVRPSLEQTTQIFNVHEAKMHFSRLVDQAAAGEEIIIAKAGKPVAKLVPLMSAQDRPKRRLGALAGVAVIPADFDAPLPDEVIDTFEGR